MKKIIYSILCSAGMIIIPSCGGVVGNINRYNFNVSSDKLVDCFNDALNKNILLKIPNDTLYKQDSLYKDTMSTNIRMEAVRFFKIDNDTLCISFKIKPEEDNSNRSFFIVTHYGKYRDVLTFNSKLSRTERGFLLENLEEKILPNIVLCAGKYEESR